MNWQPLTSEQELENIIAASHKRPQVLFKHSTRCSISVMAKSRMERGPFSDDLDYHYLDLLNYRNISGLIAERFSVQHESPQALIIVNGECIFDESHNTIDPAEILEQAGRG